MKRGSYLKIKKGLSTIVSTLLILLLVFVAIGILWVVVRNVIQGGAEQVSLGKFTLDLAIDQVQIYETGNDVSVKVKRNPGAGEFIAIKFIFSDGENSETFDRNVSLKEYERKDFVFTLQNINKDNLKMIQIAPIFRLESGKEVVGDVKSSWEKGAEEIPYVELEEEEETVTECENDSQCTGEASSENYCSTDTTQVLRDNYVHSCNLNLFVCQSSKTTQVVQTCQSGFSCQSGSCISNQQQLVSNAKIISVSASGYDSNGPYTPEKSLDGSLAPESRWSSEGSNEWIVYELNQTTSVSYVRIAFYGSAQRYFDIQYSTDGSNWINTTAKGLASTANLAEQYQPYSFTPVNTKYIRFLGHGSSAPSLWNSIVEMDVNGFESDVVTTPVCVPESSSVTCSGKCGTQTNNCGTSVNCGVCESEEGKTIIYKNDFEDNALGKYSSLSSFFSDWSANAGGNRWDYAETISENSNNKVLRWTYPFYDVVDFRWICWSDSRCDDGRGGRIEFTSPPSFGNVQALRGAGPYSGGGSWKILLGSSYNEVYLSYRFKFEEGFDPVGGGKLPGFCGGHCPGGGTVSDIDGDGTSDGFSARMMFEPEGNGYPINLRYYIYHIDQSGFYGDSAVFSKGISTGEWHTVVQRVKMNTLNSPDGVLEAWLDGELVLSKSGYTFRKGASAEFGIDSVLFTSFFGGSGDTICTDSQVASGTKGCSTYSDGSNYLYYVPRKTEYSYFDDIVVYYE